MANEISVAASLQCVKGGITSRMELPLKRIDQAGNNFGVQVLTTSTSAAAVPVAGLTTYGGLFGLKNMSETAGENIIIYQDGVTATVEIGRIFPGEMWLFRPSAALGCKSATGTPDLAVVPLEP